MDRFESMRAFVNVVDNGGFAAAARKVGMSRSAVNKHVHSLEDRLGAQLLTRSTRKVTPTETGYAFYERCVGILGDLEAAEAAVSALHEEARGTLKINAPMTFGTMHLSRVVSDFMASHPDLRIELTLTDRFTDPVEEGVDVTVRIAAPPKASHLIVHEIVEARRVVCASPDYLARNGEPLTPSDLSDHACLHYGYLATGNTWTFAGPDGDHSVHVNGVICSNNGQVLRDAAIAGQGIVHSPTFIVGADLQEGRLRSVLADYAPPRLAISVLYPPSKHLSAKIRLFTDFMTERFAERPYWDLVG